MIEITSNRAIEPWVPSDCGGCNGEVFVPDGYRWLATSHGALLAILFGGSLIAMLRRPFEKPMLLHFYALGHLVFLVVYAVTAPQMAIQKVFIFVMFLFNLAILYTFYHNPASAIRLGPSGGYNRMLLALGIIVSIVYVYLGASALAVPDHPGSWGVAGGAASIVFGAVHAGVTVYSNRSR